MKREK